MKRLLTQMMTGKDGVTHDLMRYMAVVSLAVGLGLVIYVVVVKGQPFDLTSYGMGVGALFLSVGGALNLKAGTEPGEQSPTIVATSTTTSTITEKSP